MARKDNGEGTPTPPQTDLAAKRVQNAQAALNHLHELQSRTERPTTRPSTSKKSAESLERQEKMLEKRTTGYEAQRKVIMNYLKQEFSLKGKTATDVAQPFTSSWNMASLAPPNLDPDAYPPRFPATKDFPPGKLLTAKEFRGRLKQEKQRNRKRWRKWIKGAEKIILDVTLEELEARKPNDTTLEEAMEKGRELSKQEGRSTSCIVYDKNHKFLLAYLGTHINEKGRQVYDGINTNSIIRKQHCTQALFHRQLHLSSETADGRHPKPNVDIMGYKDEKGQVHLTTKGVIHHSQNWSQQGKSGLDMSPSADYMGKNIEEKNTNRALSLVDGDIVVQIDGIMQAVDKENHGILKKVYQAGYRWESSVIPPYEPSPLSEQSDDEDIDDHMQVDPKPAEEEKMQVDAKEEEKAGKNKKGKKKGKKKKKQEDTYRYEIEGGPFLSHALLWNLQISCVDMHLDQNDFMCLTFNGGNYIGGGALFPDLRYTCKDENGNDRVHNGIKFTYSPGHTLYFNSRVLYHKIEKWELGVMKEGDTFLPGRTAWVYFTHLDAVRDLKDKPPGWSLITNMAALPILLRTAISA
ncbi:hypothetical protein NM688_g2038 [Phlebia brevispora]|uniref:Uncharacterized protein n=1 Tax=Phlebia brevispora TaxID=194682 RepID=A0ACC1T9S1_9APHY|nr:hypothetical protein NM688_g2038 [Phlebia brevispora]